MGQALGVPGPRSSHTFSIMLISASTMQGTALPKALTLGPGEVQGSMEGPHTNPTIRATWQVPVAEASGQVKLDKDAIHLSAK